MGHEQEEKVENACLNVFEVFPKLCWACGSTRNLPHKNLTWTAYALRNSKWLKHEQPSFNRHFEQCSFLGVFETIAVK